ncbi:MAG: hypothetical protein CMJ85_13990 [Planctomycetes bacterium]|nr:hypothetical protein [Planctomycetota bacterium]
MRSTISRLSIPVLVAIAGLLVPLPAQEAAEVGEWVDLFDGKTLKGWTRLNGTAKYRVVDGTIEGTTVKGSPNSFLCTDRFYGDYELVFEVKLFDDALNSGVQIRSHSYPAYRKGRVHGYQVEVSTNGNAGFIYDEARRGWLSKKPEDEYRRGSFKKSEWNRYRVVCKGSSIKTWINDIALANLTDSRTANGFIGLQVHGVAGDPKWRVAWRNIRIRELGDGGGWSKLFNGQDLEGWKVNQNPESVRVEDGALVVGGKRAHVFYDGEVYSHSFKNFVFRAKVKTLPKANSGIYFHTEFQKRGWPSIGYECQVNNSQRDWRRTGGLYAIQDVREAPAKDNEWFDMEITVRGKHVTVAVNGKTTADYTEPESPKRPRNMAQRLLSRGTFAIQCHDPGSVVHYKDIRVKALHEGPPVLHSNTVIWEGEPGVGKGKHIVFIAGDHEYRGEEALPALARILAKHYGFKCTFLVTIDKDTGYIQPGSNHITNLEALKTADLMVVALRFQHFADEQMQHIEDYLKSGRPVLGLRTSTHAFNGLKGKFAKYNESYRGEEAGWRFGFGERILGEHWVGHFGRNHQQSSNVVPEMAQQGHAILRGVKRAHAVSGGYVGHPVDGSTILARGHVLDGMGPDAPPTQNEKQQTRHPVAWVRNYEPDQPKSRVFATTHGASEDILNDGFRRMLVNAHLWCLGMEDAIKSDSPIDFVGPYNPATYSFGGYRKGVKPGDIAGFDTPIYDATKSAAKPPAKPPRRNRNKKIVQRIRERDRFADF